MTSGQRVVISKGNLDIAVRTRMGQGFTVGILSHSLSTRLIVQPNLKTTRRSLDGQFPECDVKVAPKPLSFRATYGWTGFIEGSIGHEFVG